MVERLARIRVLWQIDRLSVMLGMKPSEEEHNDAKPIQRRPVPGKAL